MAHEEMRVGANGDKEFAKNLLAIMESKGYSQARLATEAGLKRSSICGYVHGTRKPDIVRLKKLADVLDVTTDELLHGIE